MIIIFPRVGVSGIGIVSPYGYGFDLFFNNLLNGNSAIKSITRFNTTLLSNSFGGEIDDNCDNEREIRAERFLKFASQEALKSAGFHREWPKNKKVALISINITGIISGETTPKVSPEGSEWLFDPGVVMKAMIPQNVTTFRVSTACASAGNAIALGQSLIHCGQADIVIISGAEVLNIYNYVSLDSVRAITKTFPRPFDIHRDGVLVGEGAGVIVLESKESMDERNNSAIAWIDGSAFRVGGCEGNMVDLDFKCIKNCIQEALESAKLKTVDYIHAHATGTKNGDSAECQGILEAFPEALAVPTSSHKGATGHLLRCSGLLGVAAGIGALIKQMLPPTIGLIEPDPCCNVNHILGKGRSGSVKSILVNSCGFCGNYVTLALTR